MRSEASKTLKSGFDLNEQEFRRIYDALVQQMDRVSAPESPNLSVTFEVKFRNGVIAEPTSLDEILGFENVGSAKIERLKVRLEKGLESSLTVIFLEFIDIDSDTEVGNNSISYSITGNDRDWVFITSSQLEDRLSRVKKFAPNQLFKKRQNAIFLQLFFMIPFTLIMFFAAFSSVEQRTNVAMDKINQVEKNWKNGIIKDPVEVTLEIAKIQASTNEISQSFFSWENNKWFIFMIIGIFALGGLALFWVYYFPFYNFLWGDYVKIYERKNSIGKFIVVGVIFSIVISVLANYISVALGIGK